MRYVSLNPHVKNGPRLTMTREKSFHRSTTTSFIRSLRMTSGESTGDPCRVTRRAANEAIKPPATPVASLRSPAVRKKSGAAAPANAAMTSIASGAATCRKSGTASTHPAAAETRSIA